ncbi:DUF3291 domain-containing protein [Streptomyces sp. NPDC057877]|uniref:DUF3291 domain-containing protein n=1 Tax=Streptomyces sp. NPDC057877 TaxID=3346269 RepID=UPI0036B55E80
MPTIPWLPGADKATAPAPGGSATAVVMASRLELRSLLSVPRFFVLSLVILRQVRAAEGSIGVSLRAEPLKRTFWTLSAWRDQRSLDAFARTDPHAVSVRRLRPGMKRALFVFWRTGHDQLPVSWDDARRRLAEQAEREAPAA